MNFFLTDFRYIWRVARHSPGVTLAIVAMLALGTGGVTAVFNPVYSTLFAQLPFPQPEQLVLIGGNVPIYNALFHRFEPEELDSLFSNLAAYSPRPGIQITIHETGKSKQVHSASVSANFFETLGVLPLRGYDFKRAEAKQAYIVSNRFWRNELMGDEEAIGKRLVMNDIQPLPIVGIMPESFDFPANTDIWTYDGAAGIWGNLNTIQFLGRLQPEMKIGSAIKELSAIKFIPGFGLIGKDGPLLQSLQTILYGDRRPALLMLGSAAVLFLVLVCAGVMNLLITQGVRRKSEMAMRLIVGATRGNLVFQLLRETLPLVIVGALAGFWVSEIASAWLMVRFPLLKGGEVVVPVKMAFFAALVLAVTVLGGLAPALYASGVNLNTHLKSGSNYEWRLLSFSIRELLVGMQISLALALLTGVGLLVSSMMFHVDVPIRWSARDMAVVRATFPQVMRSLDALTITPIPSGEAMAGHVMFFQELLDRMNSMPEVESAGIFTPIPFSADAMRSSLFRSTVKTRQTSLEGVSASSITGRANPEGFEMLNIPLVAGRYFSSADMANEITFQIGRRNAITEKGTSVTKMAGGVVIVNQSLAWQFWPGENAVGKVIFDASANSYEIIGVVRDFHYVSYNRNFVPAVYYPPDSYQREQKFIVKLHSAAFMKDFRKRLSVFEAGAVEIEVQSLGAIVSEATADTRMTLQLLGSFALLGIVIAGLGVYATTSLMAASWNREMGIRMAMGAQTWDVLKLALWRGTRAIFLGLPVGLFLAGILSRLLSSYLFQVKTDDVTVWVTSCALLLAITIIAAFIPALRATRVNPLDAMRNE